MTRKFKSGDRVKVNSTILCIGTVIGYGEDDDILVKFDNFDCGHNGNDYYSMRGIKHDPHNRQHWWMFEEDLCLLEEGEIV